MSDSGRDAGFASADHGRHEAFDYIVVGSGSAGAVVASRLSESGQLRVLLLEAGHDDGWIAYRIPVLVAKVMSSPRGNWRFFTEPEPGLANRRIYWPRGRVWGGTSMINGMLWVRGDPQEFDHWRDLGNTGWGADDVLPYFKRCESYAHGDAAVRGRAGPVVVSHHKPRDPLTDAYIAACAGVGIPENPDYNGGTFEGVGYLQFNTRRGWRWSTREAYLRDAQKRHNLQIASGAHVMRVLFEGARAQGVEYRIGESVQRAHARHEVVLCAGTVQSPQILELSGVGDAQRLMALGIEVRQHLPGVGENLRDHANARMNFRTHYRGTLNEVQHDFIPRMRAGLRWLVSGGGPISIVGATAHALARTRPEADRPDAKIQMLHLSASDVSREKALTLDREPGFSIGMFALRPHSQGWVHIATPDPFAAPQMRGNYLTDPRDAAIAVSTARMARRITQHPALAPWVTEELRPGKDIQSDDEMLDWIRGSALTSYHPIGTCRMGSDPLAVVDERLRVRGVAGLRVIDASVMPTMVSSNTHAPTVMIGERGAQMILDDLRASAGAAAGSVVAAGDGTPAQRAQP